MTERQTNLGMEKSLMVIGKEEPLVNWRQFSQFSSDARKMLHYIAYRDLMVQMRGLQGDPIGDLVVEDESPYLGRLRSQIVHPISFMLPEVVLRFFAKFTPERGKKNYNPLDPPEWVGKGSLNSLLR